MSHSSKKPRGPDACGGSRNTAAKQHHIRPGLWITLGAVAIGFACLLMYGLQPNTPSDSSDVYITEYERNAEFLGPNTPLILTDDEIEKFTEMAENGDKIAARKLLRYYRIRNQAELVQKFSRLSEAP
jgi:hypothetical protein